MDLLPSALSCAASAASAASATTLTAVHAANAMRVLPPLELFGLPRHGTAWMLTVRATPRCVVRRLGHTWFGPVSWLA